MHHTVAGVQEWVGPPPAAKHVHRIRTVSTTSGGGGGGRGGVSKPPSSPKAPKAVVKIAAPSSAATAGGMATTTVLKADSSSLLSAGIGVKVTASISPAANSAEGKGGKGSSGAAPKPATKTYASASSIGSNGAVGVNSEPYTTEPYAAHPGGGKKAKSHRLTSCSLCKGMPPLECALLGSWLCQDTEKVTVATLSEYLEDSNYSGQVPFGKPEILVLAKQAMWLKCVTTLPLPPTFFVLECENFSLAVLHSYSPTIQES